jgi:PRC-barrel domain
MKAKALDRDALRYIPAGQVRWGGTPLPRLNVRNDGEPLGKLEGFIISPSARRVRYAVVQPYGFFEKPRLVPLAGARLDKANGGSLLVDDEEISRCETFDAERYPRMSDDDLLTAVFAA